jgi:lysyl-tRNA synthetase class II
MSQLSEQEIVRREKLSKLRELGINPYPADLYPVTHTSAKVKSGFLEGDKVVLAGRLMRKKYKEKLLLQNCKTVKAEFKFTSIAMKYVLEKTKASTMIFSKNSLIWVILLELKESCLPLK